ncbi:MAG: RluA family pseudouridine synthase [Oscillospiraceae bacterium]|nr:RluA family pseudouridine synthase [Oscillospiraceae bacterium]
MVSNLGRNFQKKDAAFFHPGDCHRPKIVLSCFRRNHTARGQINRKEEIKIDIIYQDDSILVCVKPAGVLSTDEPGGMPDLIRGALGQPGACVRTVHRLDQVVSGLMVLARSANAASVLSGEIRRQRFQKEYLAVVHGRPPETAGSFTDLLLRSKPERKTYVVHHLEKGVQEAVLDYKTLRSRSGLSLIRIRLRTGRTHQIRAQFSSRGLPLVGDRKYSLLEDGCNIALWSFRLGFFHPDTSKWMEFSKSPPPVYPFTVFSGHRPEAGNGPPQSAL